MPVDPRGYLSERARFTMPDGIRGLLPLEKPHIVSFLAGKPNPASFPFSSLTLHLKPPIAVDVPLGVAELNGDTTMGQDHSGSVVERDDGGVDLELEGEDMEEALQYGPTAGNPRLVKWLTEFTSVIHKRSIPGAPTPKARRESFVRMEKELLVTATGETTGDKVNGTAGPEVEGEVVEEVPWKVTVGSGCQDLLNKAFQTVLNPGDSLLVETPVYPGVLVQFKILNLNMIEVPVDEHGLSATALREALASWPADKIASRPKVMYTTPHGSNPSGSSCPLERKLEILEVCKEYGVLVIEDDPYYFLAPKPYPSYFSLETQVIPGGGQVIRFDSFSKCLSSGMRLGFAVGPSVLLQAMDANTSAANLQANGIAQAIAYRLLRYWGIKGFVEHCRRVAEFYAQRRIQFEAITHRHLDGLATWVSPVAGMFLWLDLTPSGIKDSYELVMKEGYSKGVLAIPGFAFFCHERKDNHVRVSFSIVDMEKAEFGMAALASAIREAQAKMGITSAA